MRQISFIENNEMHTYFSFGLILRDIPNSITPQTILHLLPIPVGLLVPPCTHQCRRSPLTPSSPFFVLSQTEEPAKAGTCACDRRVLQQLALNVHIKHSDLDSFSVRIVFRVRVQFLLSVSIQWIGAGGNLSRK